MSSYLDVSEHLERELTPEPMMAPAVGSLALHGGLIVALVLYGLVSGLFHRNFWGKQGAGGAMQVSLVSSAIPLPATQPVDQKNVLATETPSQAPAPPAPKETQKIDQTAIPILGKQVKPKEKTTPKTQQHQPPQPQNRANYGETQATSMPKAMQPQASAGVNVSNGDFGSRFPWYVQVIKTKVDQNWLRGEVDPRTPRGAMVTIYFRVSLAGAPASFKIDKSSGSPTLDRSCMEAAERVDTFGSLPQGAGVTYLDVTYDCTY